MIILEISLVLADEGIQSIKESRKRIIKIIKCAPHRIRILNFNTAEKVRRSLSCSSVLLHGLSLNVRLSSILSLIAQDPKHSQGDSNLHQISARQRTRCVQTVSRLRKHTDWKYQPFHRLENMRLRTEHSAQAPSALGEARAA